MTCEKCGWKWPWSTGPGAFICDKCTTGGFPNDSESYKPRSELEPATFKVVLNPEAQELSWLIERLNARCERFEAALRAIRENGGSGCEHGCECWGIANAALEGIVRDVANLAGPYCCGAQLGEEHRPGCLILRAREALDPSAPPATAR